MGYRHLKKKTTQLQQSCSLVHNEVVARVKISFSYAVISGKRSLKKTPERYFLRPKTRRHSFLQSLVTNG